MGVQWAIEWGKLPTLPVHLRGLREDHTNPPVQHLSPESYRLLEQPGWCGLARDRSWRLLWCDEAYARAVGKTIEDLRGTTLTDILPEPLALERMHRMEPAMRGEAVVEYFQLWTGKRYLTRVWPLDPAAFDTPGIFVVLVPWSTDGETRADAPIVASPEMADLLKLSKRELEILYQLAMGLSAKEIASKIFRSTSTVERHVESIHAKMGFTTRAELVRFVVERGLLAFSEAQWQAFVQAREGKVDADD